ncbi:MAG: amidohydrolase family protein [Chitinivibrionales bacterium]|nr:amidohydrolase family protein [Chitinivibrionales bacterium]
MSLNEFQTNSSNRREISHAGFATDATRVASGEIVEVNHGLRLLLDAHMHIQSNNCAPLPLQWALKATGIYNLSQYAEIEKSRDIADSRRKLNDDTASWAASKFAIGRLGKIGRLTTDLIAKVFIGKANKDDMSVSAAWTVLSPEEWKELQNNHRKNELLLAAADRSKLEELAQTNEEDYVDNFLDKCRYYFGNSTLTRLHIALPMDMSFAHYWGRYGIPVYLPLSKATDAQERGMYFSNEFVRINVVKTADAKQIDITVESDVLVPRSVKNGLQTLPASPVGPIAPLLFKDTLHHYAQYLPGDPFYDSFSLAKEFAKFEDSLNKKKQGPKARQLFYVHFEGDPELTRRLVGKKFIHLVSIAPNETSQTFEDYGLQQVRYESAAVQFPLQIIPFYHYDPRRHFDSKTAGFAQKKAEELFAQHAFFTFKGDTGISQTFSDGVHIQGGLAVKADPMLNTAAYFAALLDKLTSNESVYKKLFLCPEGAQGLFWGIKMYPRLGFAPDDFSNFPHLNDFYAACVRNKLPITTHTSRGGMIIADYFLFRRHDKNQVLPEYAIQDADDFFADNFASPANWQNVLSKFTDLKLCFAHFGGMDLWKECCGFKKQDAMPLSDETNRLYKLWIATVVELINKHPHVYTDLSYFVNDDHWIGHDYKNTADDLVYLLQKHKDLKDRILMGSDWYMIETEHLQGVGTYYWRMFKMLKRVSKEVGWDAWHQFAVVNPLRYLGLLKEKEKEKKGSEGPFEIEVEMMEKYAKRLPGRLKDEEWVRGGNVNCKEGDVQLNIDKTINQFKINNNIQDSKNIFKNGKLLILAE